MVAGVLLRVWVHRLSCQGSRGVRVPGVGSCSMGVEWVCVYVLFMMIAYSAVVPWRLNYGTNLL